MRRAPSTVVHRSVPCLCAALRAATRIVTRLYNEEMRGIGLEVTQYTALRMLDSAGAMTQLRLGDRLAADKTTVSRNLRLLERHGWVRARPGPDRRERVIQITAAGRRRLADATPRWERGQDRVRAALGAVRFDSLRVSLAQLSEAALTA